MVNVLFVQDNVEFVLARELRLQEPGVIMTLGVLDCACKYLADICGVLVDNPLGVMERDKLRMR